MMTHILALNFLAYYSLERTNHPSWLWAVGLLIESYRGNTCRFNRLWNTLSMTMHEYLGPLIIRIVTRVYHDLILVVHLFILHLNHLLMLRRHNRSIIFLARGLVIILLVSIVNECFNEEVM
jgi:hypothetical protein